MKREPLLQKILVAVLLFASVLFIAMALHSSILPSADGGERSGKWPTLERKIKAERPKCEICGSPTQTIHHIKPFHAHPELELDPDNLIALCDNCHRLWAHFGCCYSTWNPLIGEIAKHPERITIKEFNDMVRERPETDKEANVFVKKYGKCFYIK
jgi:5-methylcytosine-specific restriction enzyme A